MVNKHACQSWYVCCIWAATGKCTRGKIDRSCWVGQQSPGCQWMLHVRMKVKSTWQSTGPLTLSRWFIMVKFSSVHYWFPICTATDMQLQAVLVLQNSIRLQHSFDVSHPNLSQEIECKHAGICICELFHHACWWHVMQATLKKGRSMTPECLEKIGSLESWTRMQKYNLNVPAIS